MRQVLAPLLPCFTTGVPWHQHVTRPIGRGGEPVPARTSPHPTYSLVSVSYAFAQVVNAPWPPLAVQACPRQKASHDVAPLLLSLTCNRAGFRGTMRGLRQSGAARFTLTANEAWDGAQQPGLRSGPAEMG